MGTYLQQSTRRARYRINYKRLILFLIICIITIWGVINFLPDSTAGQYRISDFHPDHLMMYFSVEEDQGVPWYYLAAVDKAEDVKEEINLERSGRIALFLRGIEEPSEASEMLREYNDHQGFLSRVSREIKKFNHLMKVYENKVFPIPQGYEYSFENGFGAPRTFGGDRRHEGIDIMCDKGVPLVSVSDGKILKKGWNTLGGWRLFIKGDDGIYYYYAHLYRYNDDLKAGDRVSKGQLLGYVGDSGYGEEGTTGEFLPHLHFGMYEGKDEVPVNPYPFLKKWENNTVELAGTDPELKIHEVEISIN